MRKQEECSHSLVHAFVLPIYASISISILNYLFEKQRDKDRKGSSSPVHSLKYLQQLRLDQASARVPELNLGLTTEWLRTPFLEPS